VPPTYTPPLFSSCLFPISFAHSPANTDTDTDTNTGSMQEEQASAQSEEVEMAT
jgi:hypothetical protein